MTSPIRRLNASDAEFAAQLAVLTARPEERDPSLVATVADIIESVRQQGDSAVLQLTQQHDHHPATSMDELVFGQEDMQRALNGLDATPAARSGGGRSQNPGLSRAPDGR